MSAATLANPALTLHLEELHAGLEAFLQTLQQEFSILQANDASQLLTILPVKQQQADQISAQIQQLTTEFAVDSNLPQLQIAAEKAEQPGLVKLIAQIIELSANCKDLNIQNGMTIMAIENINNEMINIFSQPQKSNLSLYDASGTKNQTKTKGVLGKA